MTDRKKTRAERQAEVTLLANLAEQEQWLRELQLREALIPREWYEMDRLAPVEPKRTKVTLRLDDKTVRWFRALGPGWQRRVDKVLQAYVLGVLSKEIERLEDRDRRGDLV